MFGAAGCTALLMLQLTQEPSQVRAAPFGAAEPSQPVRVATSPATAGSLSTPAPPATRAARHIYPYSIIPGGVSGPDELARVIETDHVVAAHYASFNVAQARAYIVTQPRAVYVSYRKGDKVYWTAKKLMLVKGETLLSDGNSEMRARCANRISDVPQLPVETNGPTESELNASLEETPDPAEGVGLLAASFALDENASAGRLIARNDQQPVFADGTGMRSPGSLGGQPPGDSSFLPVYGPSFAGYGTGVDSSPADETAPGGSGNTGDPAAPIATLPAVEQPQPGPAPVATPDPAPMPPPIKEEGVREEVSEPPRTPVPSGPDQPKPEGEPDAPEFVPDPPAPPGTPANGGSVTPKPGEVPEPGTLWLGGVAFAALVLSRKLRKR